LENYTENNIASLSGVVTEVPVFNHELFGEGFYLLTMKVERLSGNVDRIPVLFSERLCIPGDVKIDDKFSVKGQFRSYNVAGSDGGHILKLLVFARELIKIQDEFKYHNEILLDGFVCKKPVYRTTPFGREITDLLFAVNRAYNKSDYLPCVVWGRNAKFCGELNVGARAMINGRIQSRNYEKKQRDGLAIQKTAYEVSVNTIEVVD
jgi:hypothetical protein